MLLSDVQSKMDQAVHGENDIIFCANVRNDAICVCACLLSGSPRSLGIEIKSQEIKVLRPVSGSTRSLGIEMQN